MIKYLALIPLTLVLACTKSQFTKEQELYAEVARYACYSAAGQKAAEALEAACPDFAKGLSQAIHCSAVDLVVDVLTSDLEKCDAEESEEPKVLAPPPAYGNKVASLEPEECEGQGCCSHHGGQCGCIGNRVQCCDGSLSPSCECR